MELELHLGAIREPLEDQIRNQGFKLKKGVDVEKYEKICNSITMLYFHQYITLNQAEKMKNKLFNDIKKNIERE